MTFKAYKRVVVGGKTYEIRGKRPNRVYVNGERREPFKFKRKEV